MGTAFTSSHVARVAALVLLAGAAVTAARASEGAQSHGLQSIGPQSIGMQSLAEIRSAAIAAMGADPGQAQATVDAALRLRRCSRPLEAVAASARMAQVRCGDAPGWKLYVPVRVRREAQVVTLTRPAAAGVPISADQLVVQRRDVGATAGQTYTDPAQLVGQVPSHALGRGAIPTQADIATGTPLRRGDPVVLVARTGGVEVRMEGRALGPAQAGGRISVENTASHRVLRGRVAGDGLVEILP
jgi:flagella basal body P-ring formation protein FlgA